MKTLLLMSVAAMALCGGCACNPSTWVVDDSLALQRFKEQAGTENVVIVRDSHGIANADSDVTYELLVDGKPAQGRCTNAVDKPQICRLYNFGADE